MIQTELGRFPTILHSLIQVDDHLVGRNDLRREQVAWILQIVCYKQTFKNLTIFWNFGPTIVGQSDQNS